MKIRLFALLLAVCCLLSPVLAPAGRAAEAPSALEGTYADPLYGVGELPGEPGLTLTYVREEQETPADLPEIGCAAAFVADPVSGKVFYEKNAHKKMFPASTTKMLTALVVLENCDMNETAVVSQTALDMVPEEYVTAGLEAEETLSVYVLMQAMLVASANEASFVLAEHVAGSAEAFAALCNRRAKALGCEDLHFVNPNGIHSEDHYCTAYDLYLIAKECKKYPVFNEIVKMTSVTVPSTEVCPRTDRTYSTTNEMLLPESEEYYDPNCTGIKTGYTDLAGECFVAGCSYRGLDLISVALGGKIGDDGINERFSDTGALFRFVYGHYSYKLIAGRDAPVTELRIDNATRETASLGLCLQADIRVVMPESVTPMSVTPQIDIPREPEAPIRKGQVLGTATYRVDGLVYSANLVAASDVVKKPYGLYNTLAALGFALALAAVFAAVRRCRKK